MVIVMNSARICVRKIPEKIFKQKNSYSKLLAADLDSTEKSSNSTNGGFSSNWSGKNAWKFGFLGLTCTTLFGFGSAVAIWGPPNKDENGNDIIDNYSHMPLFIGYIRRTCGNILAFNQSIKDPVSEKLLPDPVEPPYYQPPYTLVIEMTDILVHPEWKFRSGWRFKKRPALELFLQNLSPFYEVVVFTNESIMTAGPVLLQMDPSGQLINYRLFREATRYKNGKHIKDLSCLNRDLSRVILVDWDSGAASLQPRNALILKKWDGSETDHDLVDLAAFLRMLALGQVDDLRLVLDYYREHDDPLSLFREKQGELMESQIKRKKENDKLLSKWTKPSFTFKDINKT